MNILKENFDMNIFKEKFENYVLGEVRDYFPKL